MKDFFSLFSMYYMVNLKKRYTDFPMKTTIHVIAIFLSTFIMHWGVNAQTVNLQVSPKHSSNAQTMAMTHSSFYHRAYCEIANMLDGKTELSIKRAVFLQEWAYLDGNLDYNAFCLGIDTVASFLKKFIVINHLQQYRTGKNFALFEYFSKPYSGNGYKPFTYDYEDLGGTNDYTKLFVTKLMRTHSGQCRSLPLYYKILAEDIGAEAYIAFAPQHVFIRHREEEDSNKWVNVELTTQSLSREIFYIESFGISDVAIRNKVYLYPLTNRETVAYLLSELASGYLHKYKHYDDFVWRCVTKSLKYYPQNILALQHKGNYLNYLLFEYLVAHENVYDDYAHLLDEQWNANNSLIKKLGWSKMDYEIYKKLLQGVSEKMKCKGVNEKLIQAEIEHSQ